MKAIRLPDGSLVTVSEAEGKGQIRSDAPAILQIGFKGSLVKNPRIWCTGLLNGASRGIPEVRRGHLRYRCREHHKRAGNGRGIGRVRKAVHWNLIGGIRAAHGVAIVDDERGERVGLVDAVVADQAQDAAHRKRVVADRSAQVVVDLVDGNGVAGEARAEVLDVVE